MRPETNLITLIFLLLVACKSPSEELGVYKPQFKDRREKTRYTQYILNGRMTYKQYCASCHQEDGKGFKNLYPPLANSDYMIQNRVNSLCIIRKGSRDTIQVNGVQYTTPMPAFPQITPIQLAELMTYIYNSWGNETGLIPIQEIKNYLDSCTVL